MNNSRNILSLFAEPRIIVTFIFGFASGLPFALSGSTLQAWYATSGISLETLGFMGLAGLPYLYKFLWAPFLDRYIPPFLGRRRGWMFIFQILLALTLGGMAFLSPDQNPRLLFFLAFILAFFSASQDIVVDAYRTEILHPEERTLGASLVTNGYRIAMLISGGLALVLADRLGFKSMYLCMSALMGIGMLASFLSPESANVLPPRNFRESTIAPLMEFFKRPHALLIILFLIFYELGNAFASSVMQSFYIRELHLSLTEIGTLVKFSGLFGILLGSLIAGILAIRWSVYRAMLVFGIMQAIGNLLYFALYWTGPNYFAVGSVIFLDNLTGGMGQAALVGFLMSLCNPRFTAFQYAGLSALVTLGRVFIGPLAGYIAHQYGWQMYFMMSAILCLPGLFFLHLLKDNLHTISSEVRGGNSALAAEHP